ncbi:hsp70 protein [Phlyctema vagabunda]|uniref:Hsp70 protein n=1 Tax=Phlyctema vagabunda TaxID=108571 RepID=A0ABR4PY23_9HELO
MLIHLAFDLGTTQCTIACTANGIPGIEVYKSYPGVYNGKRSPFPPTALLYTEGQDKPITGDDVTLALKTLEEYGFDGYFNLWKLLFHHHQNDNLIKTMQQEMQNKLKKLGRSKYDLLKDWVHIQYSQLFLEGPEYSQQIKLRYGYSKLIDVDLRINVTVPPGRDVVEHEALARAFAQGPITMDQVYLESEPTAMFASWVCSPEINHKWKVGKVYLVQDGGGGTCSWVVFRLSKLNPPAFDQLYVSQSTVCGAETISEDFEKLADRKLQALPNSVPNNPSTLSKMRHDFEKKCKIRFGAAGQAQEKRSYIDAKTGIVFTYDEIKQCFQPCLMKILEETKKQLRQGSRVDFIMLGGGLFQNEYITRAVRNLFEKPEGPRVICVTDNKRHVAEGALRMRLTEFSNPFIRSRAAPKSIGYLTRIEVTTAIRRSKQYTHLWTEIDVDDKVEYYYVSLWVVKKSDVIAQNHELAAESSFKNARSKGIPLDADDDDLELLEKVITSDFHPGKRPHTALNRSNQLIDEQGSPVAAIEVLTVLKWNPLNLGIDLEGLHLEQTPRTKEKYRVMKYTILLRSVGVRTLFSIKAWSLQHKNVSAKKAIVWEVKDMALMETKAQISASLQKSFDLGSGVPSKALVAQTPKQPGQLPLPVPRNTLTGHDANNPASVQPSQPVSKGVIEKPETGKETPSLAHESCLTCEDIRAIPCDKSLPSCQNCRDRDMGRLCSYKPYMPSGLKQQVTVALEIWSQKNSSRKRRREEVSSREISQSYSQSDPQSDPLSDPQSDVQSDDEWRPAHRVREI